MPRRRAAEGAEAGDLGLGGVGEDVDEDGRDSPAARAERTTWRTASSWPDEAVGRQVPGQFDEVGVLMTSTVGNRQLQH